MKLFASVNRKIKFREKDYVERNYIRDDGKAVIPIYLNNIDSLYMKHDYKRLVLSDEMCDYIEEVASIIPFKYDIVLQFHCPQIDIEEQERIKKVIKNNYGMEIDDIDYESRINGYISAGLFIIGVVFLIFAYAVEETAFEIIREFLFIISWVILWDLVEDFIFTNNKRRIQRLNKLQLYDSQVEFIFTDVSK